VLLFGASAPSPCRSGSECALSSCSTMSPARPSRGRPRGNTLAARGYSRDCPPDCPQVCIAFVVTREVLPVAYEVLRGDRVDVTTVTEIVTSLPGQSCGALSSFRIPSLPQPHSLRPLPNAWQSVNRYFGRCAMQASQRKRNDRSGHCHLAPTSERISLRRVSALFSSATLSDSKSSETLTDAASRQSFISTDSMRRPSA
jgi:hypothetical protein